MEWFYARGDMQRGPVSEDELRDLINNGIIAAETRVWREGMEDWLPVSQVSELADRFLKKAEESGAESDGAVETREDSPASSASSSATDEVARRGSEPVFGGGSLSSEPMPPDYTSQAITGLILSILCCTPIAGFAIAAIVQGSKVKNLYVQGDYEGALEASAKAKRWCNITTGALVAAVVLFVVYIVIAMSLEQ